MSGICFRAVPLQRDVLQEINMGFGEREDALYYSPCFCVIFEHFQELAFSKWERVMNTFDLIDETVCSCVF